MFNLQKFDHVGLAVSNLSASVVWYKKILGLREWKEESWGDYPVIMVAESNTGLALFPSNTGLPAGDSGLPHFAFATDAESFVLAQEHLTNEGVKWNFKDHHVSQSIYFRDPDNHSLEITCYDVGNLKKCN